jgi:hypothetical protein
VFGIIAGTYAGGAVVYTVFGTGRLQTWNAVDTDHDKDGTEPEKFPLRSNKA